MKKALTFIVCATLLTMSSLLIASTLNEDVLGQAAAQIFESIRLYGTGTPGELVVANAEDVGVIDLRGSDAQISSGGGGTPGKLRIANAEGVGVIDLRGSDAQISSGGGGTPGKLRIANAQGRGIIVLDGANGATTTQLLRITGGSDLAEMFEIAGAESIKPGMVVSIDPAHPGQLLVANKAYDRTVAGIVSGANGLNPGLTMKAEDAMADGSFPVSLTGRVYVWVDASYGAIHPGDLLTTSDTPGHAMKVTDHKRAQGAILGKAMTSLTEGTGLVLILVTLQ